MILGIHEVNGQGCFGMFFTKLKKQQEIIVKLWWGALILCRKMNWSTLVTLSWMMSKFLYHICLSSNKRPDVALFLLNYLKPIRCVPVKSWLRRSLLEGVCQDNLEFKDQRNICQWAHWTTEKMNWIVLHNAFLAWKKKRRRIRLLTDIIIMPVLYKSMDIHVFDLLNSSTAC